MSTPLTIVNVFPRNLFQEYEKKKTRIQTKDTYGDWSSVKKIYWLALTVIQQLKMNI